MAVSEQTTVNSSTGNGVTTVFPYTFKILAAADLEVTVDGVVKTLTTHYSVSGVGDDAGGDVTFVTAPANATTVIRRRNMALVRTTDYQDQGELPADVLNDDQDAPVLMAQQLQEQIDRGLKIPLGESDTVELPAAADRAGKALVFDENGNVTVALREDAASIEAALAAAQAAQAAAEAARNAAQTAETNAETAEANAETAETNAETAETNAELAEANAETAQAAAEAAEAQAELYAAAAAAGSVIFYDTIALGLAGTASGSTFGVKAGGTDNLTRPTVYRDDAGVATLLYAIVPGSEYDGDVQRWTTIAGEPDALQAANDTTTAGHVVLCDAITVTGKPRVTIYGGSAGGNVTVRRFTRTGNQWSQTGVDVVVVAVPANAEITVQATETVNAGEFIGFLIPTNGVAYRTTPTSRSVRSGGWVNGSGGLTTFTVAAAQDGKEPQVRIEVLEPIVSTTTYDDIEARLLDVEYLTEPATFAVGRVAPVVQGTTTFTGQRTVIYNMASPVGGLLRVQVFGGTSSGRARVRRYTFNGTVFDKVGQDIPIYITANELNVIDTGARIEVGDYLGITFDSATISSDFSITSEGGTWHLATAQENYYTAVSPQNNTAVHALRFEAVAPVVASGSSNTAVFLGDSLVESGTIHRIYAAATGEPVVNGGIGGSRLSATSNDAATAYYAPLSVSSIATAIGSGDFTALTAAAAALYAYNGDDARPTVAALAALDWGNVTKIIIFAGTNDFAGNAPLGTSASTTNATTRGAVTAINAAIKATYPEVDLLFVTPIYRSRILPGDGQDTDVVANGLGVYLREYVDGIKEQAGLSKTPVCDLYRTSGICATNATAAILDGVHPTNDTWYGRLGTKITAWVGTVT